MHDMYECNVITFMFVPVYRAIFKSAASCHCDNGTLALFPNGDTS